jgi:hypothetical protein
MLTTILPEHFQNVIHNKACDILVGFDECATQWLYLPLKPVSNTTEGPTLLGVLQTSPPEFAHGFLQVQTKAI